jgi:hypothetical protein
MMLGQILILLECLELLLELGHLSWIVTIQMTLNIVVGIVTRLQTGQQRNRRSVTGRDKRVFSKASRPAVKPLQWELGIFL